MKRSILIYHGRRCARLSLADYPLILANWQQAIGAFHALYDTLQVAIAHRKQLMPGVTQNRVLIEDLKQLCRTMELELKSLLHELDEGTDFREDANALYHICVHTRRLEKQTWQIRRTLKKLFRSGPNA